jgi:site-specific recombinase XerD
VNLYAVDMQPPCELWLLPERGRRVSGIALLVAQLRLTLRRLHYSRHTEKAYVGWLRRFFAFSRGRHPLDVDRGAVTAYLSSLAGGRVSAATQHQAASSLAFLFREVLGRRLDLRAFERARASRRVPEVLNRDEVEAILGKLGNPVRLMAALMYGAGLRLG